MNDDRWNVNTINIWEGPDKYWHWIMWGLSRDTKARRIDNYPEEFSIPELSEIRDFILELVAEIERLQTWMLIGAAYCEQHHPGYKTDFNIVWRWDESMFPVSRQFAIKTASIPIDPDAPMPEMKTWEEMIGPDFDDSKTTHLFWDGFNEGWYE